jgi:hypothetical protein
MPLLRRPLLLFLTAAAVAGCGDPARSPTDKVEALVCPEITGSTDPLEMPFADTPALDARIRAFVSAARGLSDVTIEVEQRAVEACRRIAKDLGEAEPPAGASLDVQCGALRGAIAKLAKDGIELRVSIAAPRCEPDASRRSRCDAVAAPAGSPETQLLCNAEGELYARCSMPSVSFAASTNAELAVRLGRSLEENLPTLLYAELALAKRLLGHVEGIVATSPRIAADIKDAGPKGIACVGLATNVTLKSAERLRSFLSRSASTIGALDPEIREPARRDAR